MRRDTERRLQGGQRRTLAATGSGGSPVNEGKLSDHMSCQASVQYEMQEGGDFAHGRQCRTDVRICKRVEAGRSLETEPPPV